MNQSVLRIAIIVLALITGVIHLALGVGGIASGNIDALSISFVLNGLAFIGLLVALFTPSFPILSSNRRLAHFLMIGLAAVTFVLYFVVNGFALTGMGPVAIISKLAELLLIVATFLHMRAGASS